MGRMFTQGWGTEAEIEFLNGIGSFNKDSIQKDKKTCLLGYAKAYPLRVKWGSINSFVVKNFLIEKLREFGEEVEI